MDSFGKSIATTAMWTAAAFIVGLVVFKSPGSTGVIIPVAGIACGTAMVATMHLWGGESEEKSPSANPGKDLA